MSRTRIHPVPLTYQQKKAAQLARARAWWAEHVAPDRVVDAPVAGALSSQRTGRTAGKTELSHEK
jgi:hypothetical protein